MEVAERRVKVAEDRMVLEEVVSAALAERDIVEGVLIGQDLAVQREQLRLSSLGKWRDR
jgi:hypothetical protein